MRRTATRARARASHRRVCWLGSFRCCARRVRMGRDHGAVGQETTPAMGRGGEEKGVWYTAVAVRSPREWPRRSREYPNTRSRWSDRFRARVPRSAEFSRASESGLVSLRPSHFLLWKQQKCRQSYAPAGQRFSAQYKDPDVTTRLRARCGDGIQHQARRAPGGADRVLDLLDPKWKGKLVKSHPGYSGTSLTGTYAITKLLGWEYLDKLSKQGVQQLQSTTAPPKSIASGERAVMVDGNEYNMFIEIDAKSPVKIIYAKEGHRSSPRRRRSCGRTASQCRARAAELLYTAKTQQLLVNDGGCAPYTRGEGACGPHAAKDIKLLPTIRRNASADRGNQKRYTRCRQLNGRPRASLPAWKRAPKPGARGRSSTGLHCSRRRWCCCSRTRALHCLARADERQDDAKILTLANYRQLFVDPPS